MKTLVIAVLAASLVSGGVQAGSMKRIKKEADFRAMIVDKKLTNPAGWAIIKSNGKIGGKFSEGKVKGKIKGAWNWQNGYYCRTVKIGKKDFGFNCNVIKTDGTNLDFIRDQGKGVASSWIIN